MTLNETKTKTKYRYLGFHINEFMEHKYTIREITKSASRALSAVYTKFLSCGGMSFDVYTKLYKTLIEPVLLHGAGLWGHNNWREVQTIQNKACRLFMGSSSNASNVAVLGDMGYKTTKSTELLETYRLFLRVRYTYDYRITHKVHMWGMNISRSWDKKCYEIAHKLGIHDIIDSQYSNRHKIYDIKTKLCEIEKQEWVEKLYQDRNEANAVKFPGVISHQNDRPNGDTVSQPVKAWNTGSVCVIAQCLKHLETVTRVDVVWDAYIDNYSLKAATRSKREREYEDESRVKTKFLKSFLRDDNNKKELFSFLSQHLAQQNFEEKVVVATNAQDVLCYPPRDDV
ncbi:unnamed protein product [Mytilus coruscus]|uniref:Uncharacterized protein n=1 Tax=Mytilus coruscus TaxID=42192 RepID=A0A6J8BCR1_MYTCO|nr:unnamed protein product [Mytilus coruscus]